MKRIIVYIFLIAGISSCKDTFYVGSVGQHHDTQVLLTNSNFRVLGSFEGTATYRKKQVGIKEKEGIVSSAKQDFLQKAKSAGVELTGSRAIINVVTDIIENKNRITVTYAGEIIEFTK